MASDDFTNSDSTPLATHNSAWGGDDGNVNIISNAAQNTTNYQTNWVSYNTSTVDYSQALHKAMSPVNANKGVVVRGSSNGTPAGYVVRLGTVISGNYTTLDVYVSTSLLGTSQTGLWDVTEDHTLAIEVNDNGAGADIDTWINGTKSSSPVNEASRTYDSGRPALLMHSNGNAAQSAFDDWTDEYVEPPTPVAVGTKVLVEHNRLVTN